MSSVASEAALIGVDWGTTSFRACLMDRFGEVIDSIVTADGILHVSGRFEEVFERNLADWLADGRLSVVVSGMITSRNGWVETPYLNVPAGAEELAASLTRHRLANGRCIHFVTGLTTSNAGIPDVMRGEETQIVGAAALGTADGMLVLPGTHSKWARVRAGRVEGYATYMTGELYSALRSHTILGKLMRTGPFSAEGFRLGVDTARRSGGELLHTLFSARTLPLFGRIREDMAADYLSGLLIGAEIQTALRGGIDGQTVTIIGRGDLCDRYRSALCVFGVDARQADERAAAYGQARIAEACNLLISEAPVTGAS